MSFLRGLKVKFLQTAIFRCLVLRKTMYCVLFSLSTINLICHRNYDNFEDHCKNGLFDRRNQFYLFNFLASYCRESKPKTQSQNSSISVLIGNHDCIIIKSHQNLSLKLRHYRIFKK